LEAHFVKVSGEMLRTDFMPRSNDTALEQRECGFHGVGVDVAMRVLLGVLNAN
jgi:hypothetical protein